MHNSKSKIFKIIISIIILLIAIFLLTNRTTNFVSDPLIDEPIDETEISVSDYVIPKMNSLYSYYSYEDENSQSPTFYMNTMLIRKKDDLLHLKTVMSDFSEFDTLYSYNKDSVNLLFETYINTRENLIDNFTNNSDNLVNASNFVILKTPLELNTTWEYSDNAVSQITNLNTLLELPFGNFSAIEVQTSFADGRFRSDYYVENIGLVKSIISDITTATTKTYYLNSINYDNIVSKSYLYTYDPSKELISIELYDISIGTNPSYIQFLEDMLKFVPTSTNTPLINTDTTIKSISIDRENNITNIEFDANFLTNNEFDINSEEKVLQAISNTVGNYCKTKYVKITTNGTDLKSEQLNSKNPFEVDLQ